MHSYGPVCSAVTATVEWDEDRHRYVSRVVIESTMISISKRGVSLEHAPAIARHAAREILRALLLMENGPRVLEPGYGFHGVK